MSIASTIVLIAHISEAGYQLLIFYVFHTHVFNVAYYNLPLVFSLLFLEQPVACTYSCMCIHCICLQGSVKFGPDDVYLSYLPLAHVYEKVNQVTKIVYSLQLDT